MIHCVIQMKKRFWKKSDIDDEMFIVIYINTYILYCEKQLSTI